MPTSYLHPYPSSSRCEQKLSSPCLTMMGPGTQSSQHILPTPRANGLLLWPGPFLRLTLLDPGPAPSSSILSPQLLPETRMFFKTHFCLCLPKEDMGQRGVEGPSLDPGQARPPRHTGFLNIESSNREHLHPRGKKKTRRFTEAPPSSDGVGVHQKGPKWDPV